MSRTLNMLDTDANPCQSSIITAPFPIEGNDAPCEAMDIKPQSISSWGGPRPGFGGKQPGAGRPRKPKPITIKAYAVDTPMWCVIAFWCQAERSAVTSLSQEGYETYLPMVAVRRRDPVILTVWHTVRVPYLPGYGFIRITQSESREPIQATRGVRDVLRRPDGRAAWVTDGEIERLKAADAERLELPKEFAPVLAVGTKVRISSGAFMTYIAKVLECDGVKTCVEALLFGRPTPIWFDRVGLEVL